MQAQVHEVRRVGAGAPGASMHASSNARMHARARPSLNHGTRAHAHTHARARAHLSLHHGVDLAHGLPVLIAHRELCVRVSVSEILPSSLSGRHGAYPCVCVRVRESERERASERARDLSEIIKMQLGGGRAEGRR